VARRGGPRGGGVLLYLLTFSSKPVSDTFTWLHAGLAAVGTLLFYRLVRSLSGDTIFALLGGALLASSFA
jgi:hypothetical protein